MRRFETTIGTCAIDWDEAGVTRVCLPRERDLRQVREADHAGIPAFVTHAAAAITRLFDGRPETLCEIPLSGAGVDGFARRVYAVTRAVGPGEITTYGAIARELGDVALSRAVGAALGANPTPIVVPCHRVLAADGSLHGFSAPGGLVTKRRMLEIEGAPGFTQRALFA